MAAQVLVDKPYVVVTTDDQVPCIIVQLRAFANQEEFKQFMLAGLAHFQTRSSPVRPWG